MLAAVDISDIILKFLENSIVAGVMGFVFWKGLEFLKARDTENNSTIKAIVERMDKREEQFQAAIDLLRSAVGELTSAVNTHLRIAEQADRRH